MTDDTTTETPEAMTLRLFMEALTEEDDLTADLRTSEKTIARLLGVHADTLSRWRSEGRGPDYHMVGDRVTYSLPLAARYVERRRHAGGDF
jgi:hypothetical protein